MSKKITSLDDLRREKDMLKLKQELIYSEMNQQVEKAGVMLLKNTLTSILNRFKK